MFITIQNSLGSSRHYHPRIFITTQTIWGVVDITIQEFPLPSKTIFWWFKSVENEQDFEFLAGMLLLRRVNGSSSFYKGLRTCKVWKSADPSGPWTFKLYLSLDLCKNYYSHLYFTVVTFLTKIQNWCYITKKTCQNTTVKKVGW